MTLKTYTHAPLPFIGQKRRFVKPFKALLNDYISNDGTGWTILDAFGGSGLLAHAAKRTKPAARVIYSSIMTTTDMPSDSPTLQTPTVCATSLMA